MLAISVNGTGYTSEIFQDLVSAFDVLQRGNVSVLSQRCLLQPVEPDYSAYISMGDRGGGQGVPAPHAGCMEVGGVTTA